MNKLKLGGAPLPPDGDGSPPSFSLFMGAFLWLSCDSLVAAATPAALPFLALRLVPPPPRWLPLLVGSLVSYLRSVR